MKYLWILSLLMSTVVYAEGYTVKGDQKPNDFVPVDSFKTTHKCVADLTSQLLHSRGVDATLVIAATYGKPHSFLNLFTSQDQRLDRDIVAAEPNGRRRFKVSGFYQKLVPNQNGILEVAIGTLSGFINVYYANEHDKDGNFTHAMCGLSNQFENPVSVMGTLNGQAENLLSINLDLSNAEDNSCDTSDGSKCPEKKNRVPGIYGMGSGN